MSGYFKYIAIFQTELIQRPAISKLIADPVKVEFFTGPQVLNIPVQMSRVMVQGQNSPITQSAKLSINEGRYVSITVRTKDSNPYSAKQFCEAHLDTAIAGLSLLCDPGIFAHQVYRGWVLEEQKAILEAWIQIKPPVVVSSEVSQALENILSKLPEDKDLKERFSLMSRFLAKELLVPPSEEKFLYLWTILEIFPMKGTSDIRPISVYLAKITGYEEQEVKAKLQIGRLCRSRGKLVHDGKLDFSYEELGSTITKLEEICLTVMRSMCGLPYSGVLDKYLKV
jgi:hypothetical protein